MEKKNQHFLGFVPQFVSTTQSTGWIDTHIVQKHQQRESSMTRGLLSQKNVGELLNLITLMGHFLLCVRASGFTTALNKIILLTTLDISIM